MEEEPVVTHREKFNPGDRIRTKKGRVGTIRCLRGNEVDRLTFWPKGRFYYIIDFDDGFTEEGMSEQNLEPLLFPLLYPQKDKGEEDLLSSEWESSNPPFPSFSVGTPSQEAAHYASKKRNIGPSKEGSLEPRRLDFSFDGNDGGVDGLATSLHEMTITNAGIIEKKDERIKQLELALAEEKKLTAGLHMALDRTEKQSEFDQQQQGGDTKRTIRQRAQQFEQQLPMRQPQQGAPDPRALSDANTAHRQQKVMAAAAAADPYHHLSSMLKSREMSGIPTASSFSAKKPRAETQEELIAEARANEVRRMLGKQPI